MSTWNDTRGLIAEAERRLESDPAYCHHRAALAERKRKIVEKLRQEEAERVVNSYADSLEPMDTTPKNLFDEANVENIRKQMKRAGRILIV